MTTQIWAHQPSGERYAVETVNGKVVGANGPLHYSEIATVLGGDWDLDSETTDWVRENADSFADVTDQAGDEVAGTTNRNKYSGLLSEQVQVFENRPSEFWVRRIVKGVPYTIPNTGASNLGDAETQRQRVIEGYLQDYDRSH